MVNYVYTYCCKHKLNFIKKGKILTSILTIKLHVRIFQYNIIIIFLIYGIFYSKSTDRLIILKMVIIHKNIPF